MSVVQDCLRMSLHVHAWKRKDTVADDRFTLMSAVQDCQYMPLESCPVEIDIAVGSSSSSTHTNLKPPTPVEDLGHGENVVRRSDATPALPSS